MTEEIEVIKYLMTNIEIHRIMLRELYKKKEVKDYLYSFIRYQMREYTRFNVSLRRMLETRTKKVTGTKNAVLGIATSLGNKNIDVQKSEDYIEFFKEAAKVNILDLKRLKENYKITSKHLLNLISRLEEFEQKNIEIIDGFNYTT